MVWRILLRDYRILLKFLKLIMAFYWMAFYWNSWNWLWHSTEWHSTEIPASHLVLYFFSSFNVYLISVACAGHGKKFGRIAGLWRGANGCVKDKKWARFSGGKYSYCLDHITFLSSSSSSSHSFLNVIWTFFLLSFSNFSEFKALLCFLS